MKLTKKTLKEKQEARQQVGTATTPSGLEVSVRKISAEDVMNHQKDLNGIKRSKNDDGSETIAEPTKFLKVRRRLVALAVVDDSDPEKVVNLYDGEDDASLLALDLDEVREQYAAVKEVNQMGGDLSFESQIEAHEKAIVELRTRIVKRNEAAKN